MNQGYPIYTRLSRVQMQFALTNLIYLNKTNPEYPIYTRPSQVRMQFIPTRLINLDIKGMIHKVFSTEIKSRNMYNMSPIKILDM